LASIEGLKVWNLTGLPMSNPGNWGPPQLSKRQLWRLNSARMDNQIPYVHNMKQLILDYVRCHQVMTEEKREREIIKSAALS
jgi:hypothetical protein